MRIGTLISALVACSLLIFACSSGSNSGSSSDDVLMDGAGQDVTGALDGGGPLDSASGLCDPACTDQQAWSWWI